MSDSIDALVGALAPALAAAKRDLREGIMDCAEGKVQVDLARRTVSAFLRGIPRPACIGVSIGRQGHVEGSISIPLHLVLDQLANAVEAAAGERPTQEAPADG